MENPFKGMFGGKKEASHNFEKTESTINPEEIRTKLAEAMGGKPVELSSDKETIILHNGEQLNLEQAQNRIATENEKTGRMEIAKEEAQRENPIEIDMRDIENKDDSQDGLAA